VTVNFELHHFNTTPHHTQLSYKTSHPKKPLAKFIMASPISLNTQAAVGTDSPQPSGLLTSQQDLSPTANSNFALFPKLPIELRLIVWEMALPGESFSNEIVLRLEVFLTHRS
jgi:hypothetical protein